MMPNRLSGKPGGAGGVQPNRSLRRLRRRGTPTQAMNQSPRPTLGASHLRPSSNSHIQVVPRVADSNEHSVSPEDDVPVFRTPSYQMEAGARSPTLNQGLNAPSVPFSAHAQATFADMARSGIRSRTPDMSSRDLPNSPEVLSDSPSADSGSGIVKFRPSSRAKVPKFWKPLELDYTTTFRSLRTNLAATPDSMSQLNDDTASATGNMSSETVAACYEVSLGAEKDFTPDGEFSDQADGIEEASVLPDSGEESDFNAAALRSHFEAVQAIFGILPSPEVLDKRVGLSHAELVFFLHPNGDVAAHIWSLHAYQWISLGLFSYSRKKVEGPLAQERLRGQKIGGAVPPGSLEYFRACAVQRQTASSPRTSIFSFRPDILPLPTSTTVTRSQSPLFHAQSLDSRTKRAYLDRLSMPPPSFIPAAGNRMRTEDTAAGVIGRPTTGLPSVTSLPLLSSSSAEIASQPLQYDGLFTSFERYQQAANHHNVRNESSRIGNTNDAYESSELESSSFSPDVRHEMPQYIQEPVDSSRLNRPPAGIIPIPHRSVDFQPRLLVPWGIDDSLAPYRSADGLEILARHETPNTNCDPFRRSKSTYFGNMKLGDTGPGADRGGAALALLGVPGGHRERGRTVLHDPFRGRSESVIGAGRTDRPIQANLHRDFGTSLSNETPRRVNQARVPSSTSLGALPLQWTVPWFGGDDSDAGYGEVEAGLTGQGQGMGDGQRGFNHSVQSSNEQSAADKVLLPVGHSLVSYTMYSPQNNIRMLRNWSAHPRRCIDDTPDGRSSFFANFHARRQE